jgi:hypothetical protein
MIWDTGGGGRGGDSGYETVGNVCLYICLEFSTGGAEWGSVNIYFAYWELSGYIGKFELGYLLFAPDVAESRTMFC